MDTLERQAGAHGLRLWPHAELLCLLNHAQLPPAAWARAQALASDPRLSYDEFWQLSQASGVSRLTAKHLARLDTPQAAYDAAVRCGLRAQLAALEAKQQRTSPRLRQLLQAFAEQGLRVVLLKGSLLGATVYGDVHYKKMNDADLLVAAPDILPCLQVMQEQGFLCTVPGYRFRAQHGKRSHHAPPFFDPHTGQLMGLHWNLASPAANPYIRDLFVDIQPVAYDGIKLYRLSWEKNLLHLCLHLPFFKIGLRELADISNLCLFVGKAFDWDLFYRLAEQWQVQAKVYRALSLAAALIPWDPHWQIPPTLSRQVNSFYRRDTEARLSDLLLLLHARSVYAGRIEKAYARYHVSRHYRVKAQALAQQWQLFLRPPPEECKKFLHCRELPLGGRLLATAKLWRAMAQDFGHRGLAAITLHSLWDFARESYKHLRQGAPDAKAPAADKHHRLLLQLIEGLE